MMFSWKIYGLLALACCINLTVQTGNEISNTREDDPRCKDFLEQGGKCLENCGIVLEKDDDDSKVKENVTALITQGRCVWKEMQTIKIIKENVEVCKIQFPNDNEELFCGVQVLVCAVDKLLEQCPSLNETEQNNNANNPK